MIENLDNVFIVRNLELFKNKAIKSGEPKDLLTGDLFGYDKKKRLIQVWGSNAKSQYEYFQWVTNYWKDIFSHLTADFICPSQECGEAQSPPLWTFFPFQEKTWHDCHPLWMGRTKWIPKSPRRLSSVTSQRRFRKPSSTTAGGDIYTVSFIFIIFVGFSIDRKIFWSPLGFDQGPRQTLPTGKSHQKLWT